MKNKKYLVIEKLYSAEGRCKDCDNVGILYKHFNYSFEVAEEVMEVNRMVNVKILGMYKLIENITIDKDANSKEKIAE